VIKIKTGYELFELLNRLKAIEKLIGREDGARWGQREIDLDILLFNDLIFSDDRITVPHKELTKRDFVIIPLAEIEPDLIHPALNQKISDICIVESEKTVIGTIQQKLTFGK
jgi:7,8-dihydro-6-hydroxymethylpterin-pyrophosphokinase